MTAATSALNAKTPIQTSRVRTSAISAARMFAPVAYSRRPDGVRWRKTAIAIASTAHTATSGGKSIPNVVLAGDVRVCSQVGGVPVMKPFAQTRSAPLTIAPIARVMISGSMRHRWQM